MINDLAWNVFKNTGDINFYLEFKEIKNLEKNLKDNINEANKGKWNNFS